MKRMRRNHGATVKAQAAPAAVKSDKTLALLAEQCSVHPSQITELSVVWKQTKSNLGSATLLQVIVSALTLE